MDKTTTETKTEKKRYNMTGLVQDLVERTMKDGHYVTFKLVRAGKKQAQSCVAFLDKADQLKALLGSIQPDAPVKLFGYFDNREFKAENGEIAKSKRFKVLWSGLPGAKKADAEAEAQAAA